MSTFTISEDQRAAVHQWLSNSGMDVELMDDIVLPDVSWQRLICRERKNAAVVSVCLYTEPFTQDEYCFVVVSTDLRRAHLFWRWVGDWRLKRRIEQVLVENGAYNGDDGLPCCDETTP